MWNPHVSALAKVNILLAGLLLGLVFVQTGRVWMPWMLHFSWNVCEGMLLGLPVSGLAIPSLFRLRLVGTDLMTGGAFGLEGSLWNTVALSAILFVMLSIGVGRARQRRASVDAPVGVPGTPAGLAGAPSGDELPAGSGQVRAGGRKRLEKGQGGE
jgi:hypothetical protein